MYDRKGIVNLYNGIKLGRGSFVNPEKDSYLIEAKLENFKVRFWKMRIWIKKI